MLRFIYKIDLRTELSSISPQLYHNLYYEAFKIDKDTDRYSKEDVEKALSDTLFNELEKYIVLYPYVYIKKQLVNFVDNKITKKVLKKEQLVDFKRVGCFVVKDELKIASENKTITIEARIEHLCEVLKRMKNKKNCENIYTNLKSELLLFIVGTQRRF